MIKMLCPEAKNFSEKGLEYAKTKCSLTAVDIDQIEFDRIAPEYDGVLVRFNTCVGAEIMGEHSILKTVLSPTTGLNHIDMDAAKLHGVQVLHLRGQKKFLKNISATAEHTVALMLSLLRKIPDSFEDVKKGNWQPGPFRGTEVSGKTLGIVGYGRLGRKVAHTAKAMGMNIVIYDPYVKRFPKTVTPTISLDSLLRDSDIISLHLPLNDESRNLFKTREFKLMKDSAFLINTSRGEVVSTNSMLDALKSGHLAGAAVDVLEKEHAIENSGHPMIEYAIQNDNLLITPHISGSTHESVEKTDLFIINKFFQSNIK
jgi:D-3-phosphoglycerate dehydrogenase / 2-oxoglutarate reductase